MRITATQIERWSTTREAQGLLPVLVRRLIGAWSKTTALTIPGGDSIVAPGWDGFVETTEGNPWVPIGLSYWEFGCSADISRKASADFKKRTDQTSSERAAESTFAFVSPRRWRQKLTWRDRALSQCPWRDVRAYDADDLEAWLEAAGSVTLWFGEQLGLTGSGIESLSSCWASWSQQTRLPILEGSFLIGREAAKESLLETLAKKPNLIGVEADSSEEAAAFVALALESHGIGDVAACVTSADGWRFCDANAGIRIGLAASPEVAARRAPSDGFTLIVPLSTADRRNQLMGSAARAAGEPRVLLERQQGEQFEEAMRQLGEERSDATRLRHATGRSWSVYRRLRARNPAIRHPAWLKGLANRTLAVVTLVGAWSAEKSGDRACLEAVSGVDYETLEADLRHLARLDDPPVLQIGAVWKAKAPIDLLHLVGPELTQAQLDRFFSSAAAVLAKPDPSLELDEDKRWAAAVYGNVREESGLVLDALVDSLAKLSVYAEDGGDVHHQKIRSGVAGLVRSLLHNADGERWLSLAGILRELAEAAPNEFLEAIEHSLRLPDQPVARLIRETTESAAFGRCWYADLLWALEVLAWSPARLARVSACLVPLVHIPIKGNWANSPLATLVSFFRPWWPQTAAGVSQRIAVLEKIIADDDEVAWDILYALVPRALGGWATANAKPRWRDDDAGTGTEVQSDDHARMLSEVGARVIAQAKRNAARIAKLVDVLDSFDGTYKDSIVCLVEDAAFASEDDRAVVRASVRKYLNWHNSYNRDGDRRSRVAAEKLRKLFDRLAPDDAIARHAWLFENGWVGLPDGREGNFEQQDEQRERLRKIALDEILRGGGLDALTELAARCGNPWLVGWQIAQAELDVGDLSIWLINELGRQTNKFHLPMIGGVLCGSESARRRQLVDTALARLIESSDEVAAFLSHLPGDRDTLSILEEQDSAVQAAYWKSVRLGHFRGDERDLQTVVERLLLVERPRSAFRVADQYLQKIPPALIVQVLEGIRAGSEPDGPLPDGWVVGEAISVIEKSGLIPRRTLAQIEFAFYNALEHDRHGVPNLFAEILSVPSLFLELICLVYTRRSGITEPVEEARRPAAELAWSILHHGRGVPGRDGDGPIDAEAFHHWITTVRDGAREQDRAEATDSIIGQWLSSCPPDVDGCWPCAPVRDLLERADASDIREGFGLGIRNNRGITSRRPDEGGVQERVLVKRYKELAGIWLTTHPRLAHEFDRVADYYLRDAQREDWDAQLNIERN
ncbi:hypothetical protein H8A99_02910 [Bradyrhizobium sp. Arg68]|uniref:hypothetical protein n=1 Tax=Bradyrhizobium ivorense TaxID=2511166 RepID=UPI001E4B98DD|nr:hypothetical protein [Bradyrhizobium ivorense]MCC8935469.1 hypothetical protein [Bradyrhizobium ivorense]